MSDIKVVVVGLRGLWSQKYAWKVGLTDVHGLVALPLYDKALHVIHWFWSIFSDLSKSEIILTKKLMYQKLWSK